MNLSRREWLHLLGAAGLAGMALTRWGEADAASAEAALYDLPPLGRGAGFGSLLHLTDCHAQLMPLRYREPSVNLGLGAMQGEWPHLTGAALLKAAGVAPGSAEAHALSCVDFTAASRRFGRVGGFAHLATLVKRLRADRPGALLLDGGDTWQGSATALWSRGQDMVDACLQLGVDVMTGHWEFTYGAERVQALINGPLKGKIAFVAQNVATTDFGDAVFEPMVRREMGGVPVAIIGQAFPYTPIANPRHFVPEWSFGIQEERLQQQVDAARKGGAQLVVVLSHNGMDVDLKLASRVRGIDAILGGHTHDGVPIAVPVANTGGTTLVANSGSHGKFLGVFDFEVKDGRLARHRWRLLPIWSDVLAPDAAMQALITRVRKPYADKLAEPLAVTDGLLYRRGNFNGSWDQLICDALLAVQGADVALSPGFRWGGSLLPGETITREALMDQTAITYPQTTVTEMTGEQLKGVLEDVADNIFNADPYLQQGGDMVRVGGLSYRLAPGERMGRRISDMTLAGKPVDASRRLRVAGWAPVAEGASGKPVWDVVEAWLRSQPGGRVAPRRVNTPQLTGVDGNPGLSTDCSA